jgi:sugar lactone lactonase YvrE
VSRDAEKVFILSPEDNAIHVLQDRRNLPTHAQARIIKMPETDKPAEINTFCVAKDGNLLVARGGRRVSYNRTAAGFEMKVVEEPAQVSVVSPEGKLLASWPTGFGPQAVNVAEDGAVFVAGEGRISRIAPDGKIHAESGLPSAAALPPVPSPTTDAKEDEEAKKARQEKLADLTRQRDELMKELTESQTKALAPGADADAKKAVQEKQKELMPKYAKLMQDLQEAQMTPEMAAIQEWAGAMRRRTVTGVAAAGDDVFICCSAAQGYGSDVWRTDRDFNNPKKIVQGLRGCCGQMDIQARGGELYVAENGRKQVARYDRDGKEVVRWGKSDRSGVEGFGSCCNPMNIRLDKDGQVLTSESNLGRIKRFSPDGRFLGIIGTVEIVPGCKHVAVAASDDGRRMYLLDITRSHVVVLDAKEEAPPH